MTSVCVFVPSTPAVFVPLVFCSLRLSCAKYLIIILLFVRLSVQVVKINLMASNGQPMSTGMMLLQQNNALPAKCNQTQFREFVKGVEAVLQQWTALLLVNRHKDDGAVSIIRDEILNWFWEDGEVYADELETYFEDFFEAVRYVMLEDGSCKEVADVIHNMYVQCAKDNNSVVEFYLRALPVYQQANPVQNSVFGGSWAMDAEGKQVNVAENESDEDDDDDNVGVATGDNEEDEAPLQAPQEAPAAQPQQHNHNKPSNHKKKNPFQKGSDGWCTVQRR